MVGPFYFVLMAKPKGSEKTGGRKKGSVNRRTEVAIRLFGPDAVANRGKKPLWAMVLELADSAGVFDAKRIKKHLEYTERKKDTRGFVELLKWASSHLPKEDNLNVNVKSEAIVVGFLGDTSAASHLPAPENRPRGIDSDGNPPPRD